jgi:hypothetical protein
MSETNTPVLILLPSLYPNAVSAGETLGTVLSRINAFRSPTRQIIGAEDPTTGRLLAQDTPIVGRVVAQEVCMNQYLNAGPSSLLHRTK